MPQFIKEVIADIAGTPQFDFVTAMQGDYNSRFVKVKIFANNQPFVIPAGASAVLQCERPDKKSVYNDCDINEDGTISAELTKQMLDVYGEALCEIQLNENDESVLTTIPFTLKIIKSVAYNPVIDDGEGGDGGGTSDYNDLTNKPAINGIVLQGNKTSADLNLQSGSGGADGVTFTPDVSTDGIISWTNDGGLENPDPVNINGEDGAPGAVGATGEQGQPGATFTPNISTDGIMSWTNDGGLENPDPVNIKGEDGNPGADGRDGTSLSIQSGTYREPGSTKDLPDLPNFASTSEGWAYIVDDDEIAGQYDLYYHPAGATDWEVINNWAGVPGPKGDTGATGSAYTLTSADKTSIVNAVLAALPMDPSLQATLGGA